MNNERRKRIKKVITTLSECSSELESIKDDEDDARESMPENLQNSDRYEESENCSDVIGDAISDLDDIVNGLEEIT